MGSSSVPAFSAPSLFYVPSQREATKAGVVPGRKRVLQESVAGSFHTHTGSCSVQGSLCKHVPGAASAMESFPRNVCGTWEWDRSLAGVSEESSVMAACCVPAEPAG